MPRKNMAAQAVEWWEFDWEYAYSPVCHIRIQESDARSADGETAGTKFRRFCDCKLRMYHLELVINVMLMVLLEHDFLSVCTLS